MLQMLTPGQVLLIAQLAASARDARDALLHGVADEIVSEPHPAKGESDRTGAGGFDELPANHPSVAALRDAINGLQPDARSELFALMRIGQGELATRDWLRGLSEASILGDQIIGGILSDDIDLSSHLHKGLYELGLA